MGRVALLICEEVKGPALNLSKVLDLFGIPWERRGPEALGERAAASIPRPYDVICPIPFAGRALTKGSLGELPPLLSGAECAFLYGADHSEATNGLLRLLSPDARLELVEVKQGDILCSVSDQWRSVCGPLSGIQVPVPLRVPQTAIGSHSANPRIGALISTRDGCVFGAVDCNTTRCYVAPGSTIIDIDDPVEKGYFDVAPHFFSAVPFVMYLQHSFADVAFGPAERGACLIIDDLVLRQRYGFVSFPKLATATVEHDFSCNIALIPWNWRRSQSSVVELFKKHEDRLSLSIHGCDHTVLEFAGSNAPALNRQAKLANSRMKKHQGRTGLAHDALMVFPQGAFSTVSLPILKHNGFLAAVNTEVCPTESPDSTRIVDTWRMAILRYADFPIYTRRYAFHGLYNFAFDVLLGKPCLVVTHHADFHNDNLKVLEFIDRLNALKLGLRWRSLGGVIRRAYQHRSSHGSRQIRMFGNEIIIKNTGLQSQHTIVEKAERDANSVDRVELAEQPVGFVSEGGSLKFEFDLKAGQSALVRVCFKDTLGVPAHPRGLREQMKVAMRRYASELRDELQARAPLIHKHAEETNSFVVVSFLAIILTYLD